tara:strand:+ start:706 stop:1101 length:396 start_codon:yes stop_codon:yes gene_type:complete
MKRKILFMMLMVVSIVGIVGCTTEKQVAAGTDTTKENAVTYKEITLEASNWKFTPATIEAKKGENIRLKIKSKEGTHGISIPDFNVKTGRIAPGGEKVVTFTVNKVGTFSFRCNVFCGSGHSSMTGRLIVK